MTRIPFWAPLLCPLTGCHGDKPGGWKCLLKMPPVWKTGSQYLVLCTNKQKNTWVHCMQFDWPIQSQSISEQGIRLHFSGCKGYILYICAKQLKGWCRLPKSKTMPFAEHSQGLLIPIHCAMGCEYTMKPIYGSCAMGKDYSAEVDGRRDQLIISATGSFAPRRRWHTARVQSRTVTSGCAVVGVH